MSKAIFAAITALSLSFATSATATNPPNKSGTGTPGDGVVAVVVPNQQDEYAAVTEDRGEVIVAMAAPDEYASETPTGIKGDDVQVALMEQGYTQITETGLEGTDVEAQAMKDGQLLKIVVDATDGHVKSETLG